MVKLSPYWKKEQNEDEYWVAPIVIDCKAGISSAVVNANGRAREVTMYIEVQKLEEDAEDDYGLFGSIYNDNDTGKVTNYFENRLPWITFTATEREEYSIDDLLDGRATEVLNYAFNKDINIVLLDEA